MKASAAFLAFGAGLVVFGWWGVDTAGGRSAFDEMAGLVPFAAGGGGGALLPTVAALGLLVRRRALNAPFATPNPRSARSRELP